MTDSERSNYPFWSGYVAVLKDLFNLLRDLSIFSLGVLLLFFPTTLNSILTDAGFEEGSIVGFKWKRNLVETDEKLRTARDTIARLRVHNSSLIKALEATQENVATKDSSLATLKTENKQIIEAAKQVQESLSATISSNEPLVEKARLETKTGYSPGIRFCYQEDRLQDGPERFSVHCHITSARCETARGPNRRTKQSACAEVDLTQANWNPKSPGFMGSWYEFRDQPFPRPFPQLD